MGVPRIFQWIVKKYPTVYTKLQPTCNYLCFDINGIIHPCVRESLKEYNGTFKMEDITRKISNKIIEFCTQIQPTIGIVLCIDGVAPISKMFQQRYRRYKSVHDKELEKKTYAKYQSNYPYNWDTNAITPGTKFMQDIDIFFEQKIVPNLYKLFPNLTIYFSGSNKHGEGEHKIMEYLRSIETPTHVMIHGLDADLIFLSMGLGQQYNIYLLREQHDLIGYLSVRELTHSLYTEINEKITTNFVVDINLVEKDFMVLSYFVGNDFLPGIFSTDVHQIDDIIQAYTDILNGEKKHLVFYAGSHIQIDWIILGKLCMKLASVEFSLIRNKIYNYKKIKDYTDRLEPIELDIFLQKQKPRVDHLNMLKPGWKNRFYEYYFDFEPNDYKQKNNMILDYLKGLQWNLNYYLSGIKNWLWYYHYKAAPFYGDIATFIDRKGISALINISREIRKVTRIPSSIEQLLIVLPPQSNNLIVHSQADKLLQKRIYITVENIELDYFYKIKDWEHKPKLPDIDIDVFYGEITSILSFS